MHIWVDADACPKVVKDILFRAAQRTQTSLTLVANQYIPKPSSPLIKTVQVGQGFDVADNFITRRIEQCRDYLNSLSEVLASGYVNKGNILLASKDKDGLN